MTCTALNNQVLNKKRTAEAMRTPGKYMQRGRFLLAASVALFLGACASEPSQGLYWGNYETSLYNLADNPTDRVQQRHLEALRNVVNVSNSRGWRPPPGAMLELAVYEQRLGNAGEYALLVNREYQLYPESHIFIHRWFPDVIILPQQNEVDQEADEAEPTNEENMS